MCSAARFQNIGAIESSLRRVASSVHLPGSALRPREVQVDQSEDPVWARSHEYWFVSSYRILRHLILDDFIY